jgi:sec-independent protein translocase protein TatB
MFEVGFTELLLICALALIVLGPHRLPQLAQQLGRWVGRARAMARQLREQLDQEVNFAEDPPRWRTPPATTPNPSQGEPVEQAYDQHNEQPDESLREPATTSAPDESSPDTTPRTPHERSGP